MNQAQLRWPLPISQAALAIAVALAAMIDVRSAELIIDYATGTAAGLGALAAIGALASDSLGLQRRLLWQFAFVVFLLVALAEFAEPFKDRVEQSLGTDDVDDLLLLAVAPVGLRFAARLEPLQHVSRRWLIVGFVLQIMATVLDQLDGGTIGGRAVDPRLIGTYAEFAQFLSMQSYLLAVAWAALNLRRRPAEKDHDIASRSIAAGVAHTGARRSIARRTIDRLRGTERSGRNYAGYVLAKLAQGQAHGTLGNKMADEEFTRASAARWLQLLKRLGLRPDMLCLEYGCGSLWAAEPVIAYLEPDKFLGVDIIDDFYQMGLERIAGLAAEKRPRFAVISPETVRNVAQLRPQFIYCRKVLSHIAPADRKAFLELLCTTITPGALCVVDSIAPDATVRRKRGSWSHAIDDVRRDLPDGISCAEKENPWKMENLCLLQRSSAS